ncbi:hypothetical protein GLAREA_02128 [Glarea lozoyensis ATCC 20868]|uniref:Uncharacterized protein n=1 Tax=Glarea lozoyensis (strain ATCC 20868 / MF5171) TaxID=1116229 RepID=S3D2E7_GLAL2|nr:uncharacterized protein GLAREA_02128 [Glarea lozoyensis ATCC 20868]EPE26216.1 hypothetical protein GLAREA_02128 [Glarea lozoyensis ATCC 20868]
MSSIKDGTPRPLFAPRISSIVALGQQSLFRLFQIASCPLAISAVLQRLHIYRNGKLERVVNCNWGFDRRVTSVITVQRAEKGEQERSEARLKEVEREALRMSDAERDEQIKILEEKLRVFSTVRADLGIIF